MVKKSTDKSKPFEIGVSAGCCRMMSRLRFFMGKFLEQYNNHS
jgi:hypothetical protein